ncbi:hypothetical protein, partial [uncultured Duncaniella sp.]|uniref:hypothetical protein n=1 Tax=uncultured Duncaniella sp. TaxID=2768039 RepID=UPI00272A1B9D
NKCPSEFEEGDVTFDNDNVAIIDPTNPKDSYFIDSIPEGLDKITFGNKNINVFFIINEKTDCAIEPNDYVNIDLVLLKSEDSGNPSVKISKGSNKLNIHGDGTPTINIDNQGTEPIVFNKVSVNSHYGILEGLQLKVVFGLLAA